MAQKKSGRGKAAARQHSTLEGWLSTQTSPNTRSAYRSDLEAFGDWCARRGAIPLTADPATLVAFQAAREEAGDSAGDAAGLEHGAQPLRLRRQDLVDAGGGGQRLLVRQAAAPLALIIAPTRELALQVQRELAWLYAETGARVATCVGGMDPRAEARQLMQGAHIVVGTPGRLRDHLERGRLVLAQLKTVVLDEADEMLDLGFREDLEFILGATPQERQTLMFSATVPREIETLAQQFQRAAVRIETTGRNEQHADIEYQAMRVTPGDVEHAVVNVLRFHEMRAALVFCATREAVKRMQGRLQERGFSAVALSGELTQSERLHALQALRDGRARVLVATDAWHPQVNGVVRTLETLGVQLTRLGHEVRFVTPDGFRTVPMPTYPEIKLALFARRAVGRIIDEFKPDAIHIATEGPLGLATRRNCMRRQISFTTSFHTRFPEYIQARFGVPTAWSYAGLRWFHGPASAVMVATHTLERDLTARGFKNLRMWSRGVAQEPPRSTYWPDMNLPLYSPTAPSAAR